MKKITISRIRPFDILLYEKKIFGKVLYYHCAWYIGRVWGMRCNFESTSRGPEFEEWRGGKIPKYVCRLKIPISPKQEKKIKEECRRLKDRGYDWLGFVGHYLAYDNPKLMRCDELVEIPLEKAGIKTDRPERRPRGYLKSPMFDVMEIVR